MPKVGFGTWKIPSDIAGKSVYNAIKAGYNLIDCAAIYQNEKDIGENAFNKIFNQEKSVKREDIFITSKLWNTDHAKNDVKAACERTLRDLQLEYLDLYLIHFPVAWPNRRKNEEDYPEDYCKDFKGVQVDIPVMDTYESMLELIDLGLVKSIGVSNFSTGLMWELIKYQNKNNYKYPCCANQVEIHPFLTQKNLVKLCQTHNIQITSYSTFGASSYENWAIYGKLPSLLEMEEITQIAQKHNCTEAQVLLSWAANSKNLAVIPKTVTESRLSQNLNVLDIKLDEDDVYLIDSFDRGLRFNDQGILWGVPIH